MKIHEKYINRCIELAKNGLGTTYPNPLVGSVIVHENKIIGEGWHQKAGEPHAEVIAINSVKDKSLLSQSTIYVSLEPCSHYGKTPPCSDLIVSSKIPNVVIGTIDPHRKVAGTGIKRLTENGINVILGILEKECNELNKRFFTFHNKKRPYIILKWAESADGFIAPMTKEKKEPVWITNEFSRQLVHKWRSEEAAILVGTNTVFEDNPKLDVRDWSGENPIRIILDKTAKISDEYFVKDKKTKTIIITEEENLANSDNLIYESTTFDVDVLKKICDICHKFGIQSIIIEGGSETLKSFITENIWDEARIFKGHISFNKGIKAPTINNSKSQKQQILTDELIYFFNHD